MKKLLITALLLIPLIAKAETFLVFQFTNEVRIVLKQTKGNCKSGNQAAAQRIDSKFIPGCWAYEPNPELIRITWHNGDFSVFRIKDFTPVVD